MESGAVLKPQDIKEQTFSQSLIKGYSVEEVDRFLELVYQDYSSLYRQIETLQKQTDAAPLPAQAEESAPSPEEENSPAPGPIAEAAALPKEEIVPVPAEENSPESKETARLALSRAQKAADEIVQKARDDAREIMQGIHQLMEQKEKFTQEFKVFLQTWLNMLDNMNPGKFAQKTPTGLSPSEDSTAPRLR